MKNVQNTIFVTMALLLKESKITKNLEAYFNFLKHRCMFGLFWNPKIQTCDWPQNVNCQQSIDNEVIPGGEEQTPIPTHRPTQRPTTQKPMIPFTQKPTTTKPPKPDIEVNPFIPTGNNDYMVVW